VSVLNDQLHVNFVVYKLSFDDGYILNVSSAN